MRGVIVCADDFALNQSASIGIAKLAVLKRISATSAMVLSPRWAQDVALLQDVRGQIDVGLHLDWTSDFAIAAGHGMPLGAAMRRALLGGLSASWICLKPIGKLTPTLSMVTSTCSSLSASARRWWQCWRAATAHKLSNPTCASPVRHRAWLT
jgi:hypothetical protein